MFLREFDCLLPFLEKGGERYHAKGYPWQPHYWGIDYDPEIAGYSHFISPLLTRFDVKGKSLPLIEGLPCLGKKIKDLHTRNHEFAKAVLEEAGSQVILDASKSYTRFLFLSRISYIDLYTVHLIRDPRGWCNSRKKNDGIAVKKWAGIWIKQNNIIEQAVSSVSEDKRLMLRYEDFCVNPQEAMTTIYNMVDFPQVILPEYIDSIHHHLLGNRMRTKRDIKIKEDISWQQQLSEQEINLISDITFTASRRYGYTF